jgi:hypothetical protein
VSVYLALHTSASPSLEDVAEFGRIALALGGDPKSGLAVTRSDSGALTVVLPIPDDARSPR